MEHLTLSPEISIIKNFLDADECMEFITASEAAGYSEAPVTTNTGPRMMKELRNNTRVLRNDPVLAATLYEKAKPFLPQEEGSYAICGMNELFRFYRYHPGEQFKRHRDGAFIRNDKELSYYTFMIYLNAGFEGGATTFSGITVMPETGTALIFRHSQLHEGTTVESGVKYVLRTDVMYRHSGS